MEDVLQHDHPTDKIKDVIGKGGKVIKDICATCNCKIDVQEDGHVFVSPSTRRTQSAASSRPS